MALVTGLFAVANARQTTDSLCGGVPQKPIPGCTVPSYDLEVSFDKTVHIIFPAAVCYVDLGSPDLVAGKVDGAENVIRVKAAVKGIPLETNLSVITEDGSFYSFKVKYADNPLFLNIEMSDVIHGGQAANRPDNVMEIYQKQLGGESPRTVHMILYSVYRDNKRVIKHIGSNRFGIQFLLKGVYAHNGLLYFHTQIKNASSIPFDVDFISFRIVDKKVARRTAIQETVINPLCAYHFVTQVEGRRSERTVFAMDKFTIPDDKQLVVELFEKNGGRHQSFTVENEDLVRAKDISNLNVE